jgi:SPP1 gp7 family putative phage head morphogenesis protein
MLVNGIRLSVNDVSRLKNSAKVAQALENKWDRRVTRAIAEASRSNAERLPAGGAVEPPDFEGLFIEHYFDVQIAALKLAESEEELESRIRLGRRPKTLADIMSAYDKWRKGISKPSRPLKKANSMKKAYIAAVQAEWNAHSYDFRNGGEDTQAEIRDRIAEAGDTYAGRASTIVRTETTRYYNQARRDYYDKGDVVTHYLFIAVRDKGTTPWCTAQTVNGKRGRSGLVYAKGDPLLDRETPPVHWNCRSELLPLNRFNPVHRRLIADESAQRRRHVCTPLPPGWNK